MTREAWKREYDRLCIAYAKKPSAEQASVYFGALESMPSLAVADAVSGAIKASKGWPSAADLVERARGFLASHAAPPTACDLCHGERWVMEAGKPETIRMPVYRPSSVEWMESSHTPTYARPCPQCVAVPVGVGA